MKNLIIVIMTPRKNPKPKPLIERETEVGT
jgi:hypothetical protein